MSEQTMVDETRRFDQLTADLKIQPYDTGHQKPVPSDGGLNDHRRGRGPRSCWRASAAGPAYSWLEVQYQYQIRRAQ